MRIPRTPPTALLLLLLVAPACAPGTAPVAEEPAPAASAAAPPAAQAAGAESPEARNGQEPGAQSRPHRGTESHPRHGDATDDATTHQQFEEAERWAAYWDRPERAAWQKPGEVVRALRIEPGMTVADIGAGSGYFNRHLSEAVGPEGLVLPVDIQPEMVDHMKERAREEGTPNVRPILAAPDDPGLPERGVDVVLIVNTYHHIDDRLRYFERLRSALRPGGRVAVVDFVARDIPVGPRADHKLPREHVVGEFEAAGYRLAAEPEILPYQYFLIFSPE